MTTIESFGQLCPVTHGRLAEAQRVAQMFDNTHQIVHPPGGFRTKRCRHGLRCDGVQWLCESCKPATQAEIAAFHRTMQAYISSHCTERRIAPKGESLKNHYNNAILRVLSKHNVSGYSQLRYLVSAALNREVSPGSLWSHMRHLRDNGKVVGFKIASAEAAK